MTLGELVGLVEGEVLTGAAALDKQIQGGFAADLMSDVLASVQPNAVLLTGLCNPQVVRTAQIADIAAVVFVRGKRPANETVDLANSEGYTLIVTDHGMFEACGRLYQAGLASLESIAV
jgi:predicted transcriptional regulator